MESTGFKYGKTLGTAMLTGLMDWKEYIKKNGDCYPLQKKFVMSVR